MSAVTTKYLEQGLVIPSLVEAHNPAGEIKSNMCNLKWCVHYSIISCSTVTAHIVIVPGQFYVYTYVITHDVNIDIL